MSNERPRARKIQGKRAAAAAAARHPENAQTTDSMRKAAPGNDAASSTKQAGQPPMNDSIRRGAKKRPAESTITGNKELAKEARQAKRDAAQALKDYKAETRSKKRTLLDKQQSAKILAKRSAAKMKAAEIAKDKQAQAKAHAEYEAIKAKRIENAHKLAGITRAEKARKAKIDAAQSAIEEAQKRADALRAQRQAEQAKKYQESVHRSKTGMPSGHVPGAASRGESSGSESVYPDSVTMGGETYENAAPEDSEGTFVEVNAFGHRATKLARDILPQVSPEDLSSQRKGQSRNYIAGILNAAEDFEVEVNGQQVNALDALEDGMDPNEWWSHVKENFDSTGIVDFPYKGFVRTV